jgi:hypothetical protein
VRHLAQVLDHNLPSPVKKEEQDVGNESSPQSSLLTKEEGAEAD